MTRAEQFLAYVSPLLMVQCPLCDQPMLVREVAFSMLSCGTFLDKCPEEIKHACPSYDSGPLARIYDRPVSHG